MNAKLLLSVVVILISASSVQGRRFAQLTARDWREGRRLYEERRAKSICINNPLSLRHPEQRIRLSILDHSQQRTTETVNKTVLLWHAGTVPYTVSRQFSTKQRAQIAEAIDHFVAETCVNWKSRMAESNYVEFTPRGQGCIADVGRQGGAQTIVLGDERCFLEVGDILQLMLHTLGLYHEHQRVDRDKWLQVNFSNIQPRLQSQFSKVRTNLDVIRDTPYDFASLTNYAVPDGEVHAMFEPKMDGYQSLMGQRRQFSRGDIAKINRLYPCTNHTNVQPAATTISVPPTISTEKIKTAHRCILLMGGTALGSAPLIEYYHPTKGECDASVNGKMSTSMLNKTQNTAACYLADSQQIVIREGRNPDKPAMIYGLRDSSAKQLPLPYRNSSGLPGQTNLGTAASVDSSSCISCGGLNRASSALDECYRINSSSPRWTPIPSVPLRAAWVASVSLGNDSYYNIGGFNGGPFKQLYRYSTSERRWYEEPSMPRRRSDHSAAALSDTEFIVCGGGGGRMDCDVYNATRRGWRSVGQLNTGRKHFALLNFEGRIFALGGLNPKGVSLGSVEEFDIQTEKWTVVKPLKTARHQFVAVVV